ncbi:RHS repeat-associated core domain-containing protein [Tunturiibacter gelidoferens]|uniref:RHS repeat-associated core domain-containing protein n=1 Tax=Tunturiibacter gelidiferens TaxID=3069689 RepID=A0AAU7YZK9_9BACT
MAYFLLVASSRGQVIDPVTAQKEPIPEAGHNYIGIGAETVNPADGSVSFNLPITPAPGRQLSLPFSIRFNSSAPFYVTNNQVSQYFKWTTPTVNKMPTSFDLNGWSYALPIYQAQAYVSSVSPSPSGTNYCWSTENYTFLDFDGRLLPLGVQNNWPWVDNPTPGACPQTTYPSGGAGAYGTSVSLGTPPAGTVGVQPPLAVTDRSGTVYQFPTGPGINTSPTVVAGGITPFGALAQTITDRNGNQISLNGTSVYLSGSILASGSYKDTAGRTAVSWSGLGNTAGDQITISGLTNNVSVKWTTTNVTLPQTIESTYGSSCGFLAGAASLPTQVVSEIDLPNGQKYSFTYGGTWGLLSKITYPDGGYVRYVWGTNSSSNATLQTWTGQPSGSCSAIFDSAAITDRYVSYDGSSESLHQNFSSYSTTWQILNGFTPTWTAKNTTVSTYELVRSQWALSGVTNYSYVNNGDGSFGDGLPVESSISYLDGSNHPLKTVNKSWLDPYVMIGEQTILNNGQGMTTLRCPDQFDNIAAVYEYNFQSAGAKPADPACAGLGNVTLSNGLNTAAIGPLMRQTKIAYHNFFSSGTHILDEPDSVTMSDGSGNQVKQTTYLYDKGTVAASGAKTGLASAPGLRGNATSVSQWLNTNNSVLSTTYTYFDTGQINTVTDPCGNSACTDLTGTTHTTTYGYTDSPAGGNAAGNSSAYLTLITDPLGHSSSFSYSYVTGELASTTDPNGQTTSYTYADPLNRLTRVNYPDLGVATTTYNDSVPSVTSSRLLSTSGPSETSVTVMDGMRRVVQSQLTSDPSGTDYVDTLYDGLSNVSSLSNPYRHKTDSTYGTTGYTYDALGRKTLQTQADGSTLSWSYSGSATTATDEVGNQWKRTMDAIGRLTQVLEPSATSPIPTLETDYTYDVLNNLTNVNQIGASGELPRTRSFTSDSLSRLICASNPENSYAPCPASATTPLPAGVESYSYDANGNLGSKTDARAIGTIYSYDGLNRLISKTPSNKTGASFFYNYDEKTVSWGTFSLTNTIGRLSSAWSQYAGIYSRYSYAYDAMGRQLTRYFQLPASSGSAVNTSTGNNAQLYDLAGNVTFINNGGGIYISMTRDDAGHVTAASSNKSTTSALGTVYSHQIFANATYSPFGTLATRLLGNGLTENRTYDNRGRLLSNSQFQAASSIGYSVAATYYPNGNVHTSNDSINGNWSYTYDFLNRLTGATSAAGLILGWTYDSFGNRWAQTASGTGSAPQPSFTYSKNNNHADASGGFAYDNAGNITKDNLGQTYAYYPDDSLATANALAGTAKYRYDSEGQLVFESGPNGAQVFLHDQNGQTLINNNLTTGYVVQSASIDGEKIGSWQPNQFFWSGADWLDTKRYESAGQGDISSQAVPISPASYTSLPFGDALSSIGNDPTHFTGKERDTESGLDYFGARYYASDMGRFMSPDWAAKAEPVPYSKLDDPQTLNLYSYVRNNPLSGVDPDGHYFVVSAAMQQQVQQYISTLLRTPQGAATVNAIASSNLPVSFGLGTLPAVSNGNGTMSITAGTTVPVPGSTPGAIGGASVTLDNANISTIANATGKSDFQTGLTAFTHEDQHVTDILGAKTFQGAAAAGAAGDAPSAPGANNTTGGTAEGRAQQIVGALGAAGQSFQPNAQYDGAAANILKQGATQQAAQQKTACTGGSCPQ